MRNRTGELDYASLFFSSNTTDTKQNCKNNVCFQTSSCHCSDKQDGWAHIAKSNKQIAVPFGATSGSGITQNRKQMLALSNALMHCIGVVLYLLFAILCAFLSYCSGYCSGNKALSSRGWQSYPLSTHSTLIALTQNGSEK